MFRKCLHNLTRFIWPIICMNEMPVEKMDSPSSILATFSHGCIMVLTFCNRSRIFSSSRSTVGISRPVGTMEFSPGQRPGNGNCPTYTTPHRGSGIVTIRIVSFSIALSGRINWRCGLRSPGRCPGLNYTAPCGATLWREWIRHF